MDLLPGVFATAFVLSVELGTGDVTAVSAGHPNPFVLAADGVLAAPVDVSPPLGIPDVRYVEESFALAPGDSLVLFSDGLIERKGEDIDAGLERIRAVLSALVVPPRGSVTADVVYDRSDRDGRDDVTVLTVSRSPT